MDILINILLVIFFLVMPAGVLWLCRNVSLVGKLGPILTLYGLGMLLSNLGIFPEGAKEIQDIINSAMVPLAIPMMLFNCRFDVRQSKSYLFALLSGVVAVTLTITAGFLLFKNQLGPEGYKIGGIMTGVYTGGTPNLAALQLLLDIDKETFLMLTSYDIIVSGIHIVFLLSGGVGLFRWMLGSKKRKFNKQDQAYIDAQIAENKANPYTFLRTREGMRTLGFISLVTLCVVAVSAGLALLMPDRFFMVVFILTLTTGGVIASFNKKVSSVKQSYDVGLYLIYVFCFVLATMVDFTELDFMGGIHLFWYLLFVVFVSQIIQALLSKLLRVEADIMIVSSVSLIYSPPFVPMIAATLKNRDVIVPGLSVGIIGYVLGNYLGYIMSELLLFMVNG